MDRTIEHERTTTSAVKQLRNDLKDEKIDHEERVRGGWGGVHSLSDQAFGAWGCCSMASGRQLIITSPYAVRLSKEDEQESCRMGGTYYSWRLRLSSTVIPAEY